MADILSFPSQASTPSDVPARELALDTRRSCIVEAPAGSGKTGLLVQRFLKLLADDNTSRPEEILAITFTNKATAELKTRVLGDLQAARRNDPVPQKPFDQLTRTLALAALDRDARLGWNLLAQPQRLNIRSIDSVCGLIANSLPLLSGSGGAREPVLNASSLYRSAARRTLLQFGGPDPALNAALRTLLAHRDGNLADCEALLASMLGAREQWAQLIPLDAPSLDDTVLDRDVRPRLERSLEQIVCSGLSRALDAMPPGVLEHLTQFAQRFAHLPGHHDKLSPINLCADRHQTPQAIAEHLDHWRALIGLVLKPSDSEWRQSLAISTFGFKPPKPDLDNFKLFIASIQSDALQAALAAVFTLPPARYPDDQWLVAKALFRVLRHTLAELQLLFADRSECDFTELSLAARHALRLGNDTFDLIPGVTLRHLLVDELQDTSSAQYELIKLLTQSWDGHSQTLFLVGDPKQSIYLFRQARVERFLRTLHQSRLGDIPLTPLNLTSNFRSQANLVKDFNQTFGGTPSTAPIFPPPGDPSLLGSNSVEVPFTEAIPSRTRTSSTGIAWHTTVLDNQTPNPAAQEALDIRSIIERRLALPLPEDRRDPLNPKPWTIAVLARARTHLSAIVNEFKAHDGKPEIPFRAIDLDPLDELPEVLDVLALTRALLHPADRIAWLAVLHAPWCGLGLADLLTLTGEGPAADTTATIHHLVTTRRTLLSPSGQQLLARAWPILATATDTLGRTPLSTHIERTWRSLCGDISLTPGCQANVLRFLSVLRDLETPNSTQAGVIDLRLLSERLKRLYAEPRSGNIQVDLMTIHSAKGLEWDLVLIPGLHRAPRPSSAPLLNWLELDGASAAEDATIILAPIWGKGEASDKLNNWLKGIRASRERAEEKRLFYVASTRAKEELHLFAAASLKADGTLALPTTGTLLKACWPAAQPQFAVPTATPASPYDLPDDLPADYELALAASAAAPAHPPLLHRYPLAFDPSARFTQAAEHRLPYAPAATLAPAPAFARPDGSFAVRAFGNVVHRFLQLLSTRLTSTAPEALLAEVPTWLPRLTASLRAEGLAPTPATREASRALRALTLTLADPTGLWLLSPHPHAASERTLTLASRSLRVDRTFLAGPTPLSSGQSDIWIVDFKTTEQGSRSDPAFAASELAKYTPQLEAYATLRRQLPDGHLPLRLGLFYPLIPRLLHWESPTLPSSPLNPPAPPSDIFPGNLPELS